MYHQKNINTEHINHPLDSHLSYMSNKTIITVAPTGAWPTKEHNPNIPLQPKEIAEDVYRCWQAGAAVAHIHVRDDNGIGSMSLEKFTETVERIRDKCDIVLNLTTSGDLEATDDTRQQHLVKLKPELASYDCGSMNWMHKSLFINHPHFLEKLAITMKENKVKPEIEVFDSSFFYNAQYYVKKGFLENPPYYQFVLGAAGGMKATVKNLLYLHSLLPEDYPYWSAFGIGKGHVPILMTTIALGGHVRVGMEDNVVYSYGKLADSNAQFVERAARLIKEADREVASPSDARQMLHLKNGTA